jgi:hypothetical protein
MTTMKKLLIMLCFLTDVAFAQKAGPLLNACDLKKRPLNCNEVEKNATSLLRGKDECVLALVNSVYSNIIRTSDKRYVVTLDSIATHSDGYVSDYLMGVGVKLFYRQLPLITRYLVDQGERRPKAIEKLLVESMSSYLSDSTNWSPLRHRVIALTRSSTAHPQ